MDSIWYRRGHIPCDAHGVARKCVTYGDNPVLLTDDIVHLYNIA